MGAKASRGGSEEDSVTQDWVLLVQVNDAPGVLARISVLFQRFGVNIDFVRFGCARSKLSLGVVACRCPEESADRLVRKLGSLIDVLHVGAVALAPHEAPTPTLPEVIGAWTPRELDDAMDSLVEELPLHAQHLIQRLRAFQVTEDLVGLSPAIAREAAAHIETVESENLLLSRATAGIGQVLFEQHEELRTTAPRQR